MTPNNQLIEVRNLTRVFKSSGNRHSQNTAVDDASFSLRQDQSITLTIAGESGSGKSTLCMMMLGFLKPTSGNVLYKGNDIYEIKGVNFSNYRREVQAVFQDPFQAFNPFYKIDHVFTVPMHRFNIARNKLDARRLIEEALEKVLLDPSNILGKYPHQLSGGQLQRIMLARAFLLKPKILVADEAVSMIDASLRAIILDLMVDLKTEYGVSQLYITHDLSTALQISEKILILYRGSIVERGSTKDVIQNPQHPYTKLLISSIPLPDPDKKWKNEAGVDFKESSDISDKSGCKFYNRCPFAMDVCISSHPPTYQVGIDQGAACFLYDDNEIISDISI